MEAHKTLPEAFKKFKPDIQGSPEEYFEKAWDFTCRFYHDDLTRIMSVTLESVTPEFFFREYVWVVHATGFSAKAVGKFMPRLLEAYDDWDKLALDKFEEAFERVKKVCNNEQKAKAIHNQACEMMVRSISFDEPDLARSWWERYRKSELSTPEKLSKLPYIGKTTCFHLGRNIGLLECVKPDLHLIRMAEHWGFADCIEMCKAMQSSHKKKHSSELPLGIVDLALWYAASTFGTLEIKQEGKR